MQEAETKHPGLKKYDHKTAGGSCTLTMRARVQDRKEALEAYAYVEEMG